jgi:hypothetical protein
MNDGVMVIKRTEPLDLPPDVAKAFAEDMRGIPGREERHAPR